MSDGGGDAGDFGGGDFGGDDNNYGGDNNNYGDNSNGYNNNNNSNNDHWNNNHYDHHHHHGNEYYSGSGASSVTSKIITIVITGCVGSIFSGIGVFLLIQSLSRQSNLLSAIGTIIDIYRCSSSGSSSSATYGPVIEYFDEINNEVYVFESKTCSSFRPTIGNSIKVLYDPNNPGEAYNGSFLGMWFAPIICLGVGSVVICICFVTFLCFCCCGKKGNSDGGGETSNGFDQSEPDDTLTPVPVPPYAYDNHTSNNTGEQKPEYYDGAAGSNNNNNNNGATGSSLFDQMMTGMKK